MKQLVIFLGCLVAVVCVHGQTLPANMYADQGHAPFLWGVGSFDPTADHVLLWTKVDPQGATAPVTLHWEVYGDASLSQFVDSGSVTASVGSDWTSTADIELPWSGRHYWYRWHDGQGNYSVVGRTKTAAAGHVEQVRLAVMSCSSVFSGFFNAYARIGERNDLDLVVHLGDYIYDFVDEDEQVRVPVPAPVDPQTLPEWRGRHAYYLLDPDLRLARQMHPWAAIWDNHDVDGDSPQHVADAMRAFQEYVPMRLVDAGSPERIARRLQYGDLLDLLLVDVTTLRDIDVLPGGESSLLGDTQWNWLSGELSNSSAQWRVIGQERMMARFSTAGLGALINYGDGPVADSGAWDGYDGERVRLLGHLEQNGISNNVILSGDIHTSFACDLPIDYGSYDFLSGAGSVAVEFLPTSITRGNFDEAGVSGFLANLVQIAMSIANPHHVYSELTSHGYGILDLRHDVATAEFWYSDILQPSGTESFATGYECYAGENHWRRAAIGNPTVVGSVSPVALKPYVRLWPNPAGAQCTLEVVSPMRRLAEVEVVEMATGRVLLRRPLQLEAQALSSLVLDLGNLPTGMLGVRIAGKDGNEVLRLVHIP